MARRPNPGWFKKGTDSRRHQLTIEECSRGGKAAFASLMEHKPAVLLGLRRKLRRTRPRP